MSKICLFIITIMDHVKVNLSKHLKIHCLLGRRESHLQWTSWSAPFRIYISMIVKLAVLWQPSRSSVYRIAWLRQPTKQRLQKNCLILVMVHTCANLSHHQLYHTEKARPSPRRPTMKNLACILSQILLKTVNR